MADAVPGPAAQLPDEPSGLVKLQFDYAWKWFSYHADQRTKMFYYMLIAIGIFANAVVGAFDKNLLGVALVLCVVSAFFALVFSRLDLRNEELVRLGEEALAHLERSSIFGSSNTIEDRTGNPIDFGILWRQELVERRLSRSFLSNALRGKHRFWLRKLAYVIAAIFAVGAWWAAVQIVCAPQ